MNQCNGGCNFNQQRPSCSCSGERIRVNDFENAMEEDRRRCACENTYHPRPCRPKPCRPDTCRPNRPRPCHNECEGGGYPHRKCEDDYENCGYEEAFFHEEDCSDAPRDESCSCGNDLNCGCDKDCFDDGWGCHRHKCDLYHDEFPCSHRYEEDAFDDNDQLFRNQPLAMAYVPKQRWKCPMRNKEGFEKGTIFHDLYKPFKGGSCR